MREIVVLGMQQPYTKIFNAQPTIILKLEVKQAKYEATIYGTICLRQSG